MFAGPNQWSTASRPLRGRVDLRRGILLLPKASFFHTPNTVPPICFASLPGDSTIDAAKVRHSTAQPLFRKVKSLVSGT